MNCLVTGASSGIGKSIAIELSKKASHIYIVARNIKELEYVHDQIVKNSCGCTIVPLDLIEKNGIENLAKQIFIKDKFIDVLISSAGIIENLSPVESIDLNKLKNILELNYISNFRLIKSFHPLLKSSKSGRLGVISSVSDKNKNQYWGIYQPIMTALNELVMTYSLENVNTNIKANIFYPGAVQTKLRAMVMPGEENGALHLAEDVAVTVVKNILEQDSNGKIINI